MAPRMPSRCWAQFRRAAAAAEAGRPATALAARLPLLLPRTTKRGVKYGWSTLPKRGPNPLPFNTGGGLPEAAASPAAALKRKEMTTPLRTGVLAVKKGMTAYYTRNGKRFPATVLQMDQVQVVAHKTRQKHGYYAVQVGSGQRRPVTVTAPQLGYFEAKGIAPKEHLAEFKVRDASGLAPVGVQLLPDWFHKGQRVDVRSNSRGMGFEGGMKRHNFKGQGKSHGNSLNHRTMGTTGPSQGSGSRVLPGKKMPGRMGNERVTVQNLPVLKVDNELGIIVVKGAVAGPKGALVKIADAIKKEPPSQEFVQRMNQALQERFPHAAEELQAAREKHMELKQLRREGRIAEAIKLGITEPGYEHQLPGAAAL